MNLLQMLIVCMILHPCIAAVLALNQPVSTLLKVYVQRVFRSVLDGRKSLLHLRCLPMTRLLSVLQTEH